MADRTHRNGPLRLTTSWDDGHPLDLRVAELLTRHGFAGTFYVPCNNGEGRPVMTPAELRTLGAQFEIGGHTIDHVRLVGLSSTERDRQIHDGKHRLENDLGHAVVGFCYPGGKHDRAIRASVRAAGFRYARTVTNLSLEPPRDRYRVDTTLQLYPHRRWTYVSNFARRGAWGERARSLAICLRGASFDGCLEHVLQLAAERGGVFHLWGHSWEIDAHGLWGTLDRFLRIAGKLVASEHRLPNVSIVDDAAPRLA